MAVYTIKGILVWTVFLGFTYRQFATAKILPERFHIRHEGSNLQFQEMHRLMERRNQEISRNHSMIQNDVDLRKNLLMIRRKRHDLDDPLYEMELKEVQNTSICSYTVEPVEDVSGNWMLKNLQHIKCNRVGNKCHKSDKPHCCIQTYKMIDLKFSNDVQQVKIYTGCVCAYSTAAKIKGTLKNIGH